MASSAESVYDSFLVDLEKTLGKIDTDLALHIMLYERKMSDTYPMVELEIHYKDGVDNSKKTAEIRERFGFQAAAHGRNEVYARNMMNLDQINEIAQDPQVEKITGNASVASY